MTCKECKHIKTCDTCSSAELYTLDSNIRFDCYKFDPIATDVEIIKALEYCRNQGLTSECSDCEYKNIPTDCMEILIGDAIDLIKRFKAENEELKTENLILSQKRFNIFERIEYADKLKSEARKEFAERSEKILIEKYNKYHLIANNTQLKEGVDMFYQGRAEAIWECIDINRNLLAEMDDDEK